MFFVGGKSGSWVWKSRNGKQQISTMMILPVCYGYIWHTATTKMLWIYYRYATVTYDLQLLPKRFGFTTGILWWHMIYSYLQDSWERPRVCWCRICFLSVSALNLHFYHPYRLLHSLGTVIAAFSTLLQVPSPKSPFIPINSFYYALV